MKYKVTQKQESSRMCIVCGDQNSAGLQTFFYALENGDLAALFTPSEIHQGYPGRLHGGIAASVLDEAMGRAIAVSAGGTVWGVTVDLSLKYRLPVPLNVPLKAVARIKKEKGRFFEGSGEIMLPDGSVAVEGHGRYMKLPLDKITAGEMDPEKDWRVLPNEDDPDSIDI